MPDSLVVGLPGVRTAQTATHKIVFRQGDWYSNLAAGKIISSASRDPSNNPPTDIGNLQAGLVMGKITSSGFYAPSIMGALTVAFTSPGTSMTVAAAVATELVRRQGATGTFNLTGPPSAAGIVSQSLITYSAVNVTTGVITVTDPGVSFVIGSLLGPTDGSQNPLTFIPDGYPMPVLDASNTAQNIPFPWFPIAGVITAAQLINWPADTSLQTWLAGRISSALGGKFVFDYVL